VIILFAKVGTCLNRNNKKIREMANNRNDVNKKTWVKERDSAFCSENSAQINPIAIKDRNSK